MFARDNKHLQFSCCLQDITSIYHFLAERDESVSVDVCVYMCRSKAQPLFEEYTSLNSPFAISPQVLLFHKSILIKRTIFGSF